MLQSKLERRFTARSPNAWKSAFGYKVETGADSRHKVIRLVYMPDASITNTGLADLPVAMSKPPMAIRPATPMAATSVTEGGIKNRRWIVFTNRRPIASNGVFGAPRRVDDVGRNCDRRDIDLTSPHSHMVRGYLIAEALTALSAPQ
ncbi:hypothetical protein ACNJYA_09035 [Bradyrhizobium sp. DASA03068]|uniref:hypothetical protein n=1 Tax=Bradyrhizobium sp. BLXBL-01 TaxID=3395915 RepID=UPI003F6FEB86